MEIDKIAVGNSRLRDQYIRTVNELGEYITQYTDRGEEVPSYFYDKLKNFQQEINISYITKTKEVAMDSLNILDTKY